MIILKSIRLFGIKINNENKASMPPENGGVVTLSIKIL